MRLRCVHAVGCFVLLLSFFLLTPATTPAHAGGGSLCDGDWCPPCSPLQVPPGAILITPAGTGPTLQEQGMEILVQIVSCGSIDPRVPGVGDIALRAPDAGVTFCTSPTNSDPVDSEGWTTFSGAIAGGGHLDSDGDPSGDSGITIFGQFAAVYGEIDYVSPDINGDLRVNLSDVAIFGQDLAGPYHMRSDLQFDQQINLADIAVLAVHLGESCP